MMDRRTFIRGSAATIFAYFFLPGCGRRSHQFDPKTVLNDLRANEAISKLRNGNLTFNRGEIFSEKGKQALSIIQRGLISLELMSRIESRGYGIYGLKTTEAVRRLQAWAGIDPVKGNQGRRIDQATLFALEKALQEKIEGRWIPPENF